MAVSLLILLAQIYLASPPYWRQCLYFRAQLYKDLRDFPNAFMKVSVLIVFCTEILFVPLSLLRVCNSVVFSEKKID